MSVATAGWVWLANSAGEGPHTPHVLHGPQRLYRETNCYTDVIIELLHARGDEPRAALGSTLSGDFEGDQWTFFKPAEADLRRLFGIDIHEHQPYRPWPVQMAEQLRAGRTLIVETDAFHLPDTAGTSYRAEHVKSSIAVAGIAPEQERLSYFHNRGRHELAGEDYRAALRVGVGPEQALPLYTEIVRFDAGARLTGPALRAAARELLAVHHARRPDGNPYRRMGAWIDERWEAVAAGQEPPAHDRIFASARMAGAAADLAAAHVDWVLGPEGEPAAAALTRVAEGCKVLAFKLARRGRFDATAAVTPLAAEWEEAAGALDRAL